MEPWFEKIGVSFWRYGKLYYLCYKYQAMEAKEIVEALKKRRKKMRLTQEDWASKSGITQERISDYERGKATPCVDSVHKLAKGLGLDLVLVVPRIDDDEL